ncbi:hypothetical protein GQX74_015365 [Glossina fuscipes]|nr:hypothetical protein GQX74_015365 [Glossina fuscipes]
MLSLLQTAISLAVDDGFVLEPTDYTPEYQNGMPKRVGLRKRKRRPQTGTSAVRSTALANNQYWRGHIDDDDLREPNNNVKDGEQQSKEYRRPEKNSETENVKLLDAFKREQKPNDSNEKLRENQQNLASTASPVNLKNLLKNTGGLSLSEILQQQNLSLDDLLKGKQNAILALQTTSLPQIKQKPNINQILTKPKIVAENREDAEQKTKVLAMQRLKLFGTASRPLNDINARKKEYLNAIGTTVMMTASNGSDLTKPTTVISSTTRVPIYKKILHQRSTLKPTFLLTNATLAPVNTFTDYVDRKPEKNLTNESEEEMDFIVEDEQEDEIETGAHDENLDTENISLVEDLKDISKQNVDMTTTSSSNAAITVKPIQNKLTINSRRSGYTTTGQLTRTTRRLNYASSSNSPTTTSTKMTPTTSPITSTATNIMLTTTTTASSSTMNLTPKAHTMFNSEQLKERIQESLLKNLIDKNDKQTDQHRATYNNNGDDDLENFFDEAVKIKARKPVETSTLITKMRQYSTSTASSNSKKSQYNEFLPDYDNVDDRTDLLELIEDRRSGNRLFKVLEQRNMTLEELIEHRKRGSSQLHLATIVENPAGLFPDKRVVLQDNMDIVTAFENFPHFNLLNLKSVKPDDIKTDSQGSSYFTSIIDIEPTDEIYKSGGEGAKTETRGALLTSNVNTNRLERKRRLKAHTNHIQKYRGSISHINILNKNSKSLSFFPAWKTLALASLATRITNNAQAITPSLSNTFYLPQSKLLFENHSTADEEDMELNENKLFMLSNDTMDADDSNEVAYNSGAIKPMQAAIRLNDNTIQTMENEVLRAHDLVDLELSGHGFKRSSTAPVAVSVTGQKHQNSFYTNISAGIKSAIVASTTIVLTALITFMLIFVVCRWKQRGLKHHASRNSNNSSLIKTYNVMKSKLPALITGTTTTTTTTLTTAGQNSSSTTRCTARQNDNNPVAVIATITTTSNSAVNNGKNSNSQQLQRQSSLLFQRNANNSKNYHQQHQPQNKTTKLSRLSGHKQTNLRNNEKSSSSSLLSIGGGCGASTAAVGGGLLGVSCSNLGSTTSLAFSLTSNSSTKLNAMDTNSPEVQEYLFDTLRNSF